MKVRTLLAGAFLLLTLATLPTRAQLDPTLRIYLIQNGVRVGEVFVPARDFKATKYMEHWVLYPGYSYISGGGRQNLKIQATNEEPAYRDLDDFYARVPFAEGSKYIQITAEESAFFKN